MTLTPITDALEASEDPMVAPNWLRWKVGHYDPRTIYAVVPEGASPSSDKRLGRMNTAELADEVVRAHNAVLLSVQAHDFLKASSSPTETSEP